VLDTAAVLDHLSDLMARWRAGAPTAVATVVETWSSAPRQAGASMLVGPDGTAVGSVSGGCVEGDVYARAQQVLQDGAPQLVRYGVPDDDALAVGLPCGGEVEVLVQRVDAAASPHLGALADAVAAGRPTALVTVVAHPDAGRVGAHLVVPADAAAPVLGALAEGPQERRWREAVARDARALLASGTSAVLDHGPAGEPAGRGVRVLVFCAAPPPRMVVAGATDTAAALARLGSFLGYRVTVVDARPVFATAARHPGAEVVVDWPHRYLAAEAEAGRVGPTTVVAVLTHEPRFDVPLLEVALRLDLGYVGAMGSRRTVEDRVRRLREAGVGEVELARLAAPIGLDLGARTPEETAVSIAAEVVAARRGGPGLPLRGTSGPLHR